MEPHYCPIGLHVEGRRVTDDVVDPAANAEGIDHEGKREPYTLIANHTEQYPCKTIRGKGSREGVRTG